MISPISMSDNLPQSTKLLYIMFIFFFNSTRLGCVQNLVTRQHFILYIRTFEGLFLVILSFDTSIVLLSIKAFSNQLIKPWIFNQLSPRVLYFAFFFLRPSQDYITVLDQSLSRQTWTLESWIITDRNSLSKVLLNKLSAVSQVNKLSNFLS